METKKYAIDYLVPKGYIVCCCCDELMIREDLNQHNKTFKHFIYNQIVTRPRFLCYKKPPEIINMENKKYGIDYLVPKGYIVCCYCDKLMIKNYLNQHKMTKEHDRHNEIFTRPEFLNYKKPTETK